MGCFAVHSRRKLTKEIVNERLRSDGRGVLLVGDYINARTKSEFECDDGHKWEAAPGFVLSGDGCPHCYGNAKLSKDIVNDRLRNAGSDAVLVGEYVSALTKAEFNCSKGHSWLSIPSNVMKGHGCPYCLRSTKDEINKKIKGFGVKLAQDWRGHREKSEFQCEEGHVWIGFLANVIRCKGCPYCKGTARHTKESVNEILESQNRNIRQVDDCAYGKIKNLYTCSDGHTWRASKGNILIGKGCPHCHGLKDCVYIWQSEDEYFNGKKVYKIGVTKRSKGVGRIRQCASASKRRPKILRLEKVQDAFSLEMELLKFGEIPDYVSKFDGYTEMRALSDAELAKVLEMIDFHKENEND